MQRKIDRLIRGVFKIHSPHGDLPALAVARRVHAHAAAAVGVQKRVAHVIAQARVCFEDRILRAVIVAGRIQPVMRRPQPQPRVAEHRLHLSQRVRHLRFLHRLVVGEVADVLLAGDVFDRIGIAAIGTDGRAHLIARFSGHRANRQLALALMNNEREKNDPRHQ